MNIRSTKVFVFACFFFLFLAMALFWASGIIVNFGQILVIMFVLTAGSLVIVYLLKNKKEGEEMSFMIEKIRVWWKDNWNEDLEKSQFVATSTYFDDKTPFYGFIARRTTGPRQGVDICIVAEKIGQGIRVRGLVESAQIRNKNDPFAIIRSIYPGSPTPIKTPFPSELFGAKVEKGDKLVVNIDKKNEMENFGGDNK